MTSKNEFVIFYYNLQRPQDYGFDAAIIKESVDENFELKIFADDVLYVRRDCNSLAKAIATLNNHCRKITLSENWTKIKRKES